MSRRNVSLVSSVFGQNVSNRNVFIIFLRFCFTQESNNHFLEMIDEESVAMEEVKALGKAVQEVELSIQASDVDRNADDFSFMSSVNAEEVKKEEPQNNETSFSKGKGTLMI